MFKNTKTVWKKVLYIVLALSLVAGLVVSAVYGIFDSIHDRGIAEGSPEDVVALVNGEEVYRKDYSFQLDYMKSLYEMQGVDFRRTDSQDILRQLEVYALEELINQRLIIQQAREENIQVSHQEVEEEYQEVAAQFDDEEDLLSELAEINLTRDGFMSLIQEQLLFQRYMENYLDEVDPEELEVSEEELETMYSLYSSQIEDLPDFEKYKDQLEQELIQQKYDQLVELKLQELRAESDIQILL